MVVKRKKSIFKMSSDFSTPVHYKSGAVQFSMFSADEIRALSTCHVNNPNSFNQLGHPLPDGLYDLRMGPFTDRHDLVCATCRLSCEHCSGHLGHIELPLPVVNPLFHSTVLQILKMSCLTCGQFRIADYHKTLFLVQMKLLDMGHIIGAEQASEIVGDEEPILDDEGSSTKKRKQKITDNPTITRKLQEFLENAVQNFNEDDAPETLIASANTRSLEDLRKQYKKDFMNLGKGGRGTCFHCRAITKSIVNYRSRVIYEGTVRYDYEQLDQFEGGEADFKPGKSDVRERERTEVNAKEIMDHIKKLWLSDAEILLYLYPMLRDAKTKYPTDIFFIEALAVPPPKSRPCQFTGGIMTIHPQSSGLQCVIEVVTLMKQVIRAMDGSDEFKDMSKETQEAIESSRGNSMTEKLDFLWKELQGAVDHVLDKDIKSGNTSIKAGWGFKQLIERKQGLFRMNMMGKRVNFAARTVITPDPNISIDEVGLPEVFAKTLTYRESVNAFNVEKLRAMVLNGPEVHPGAIAVEDERGFRKQIDPNNPVQREALAKTLFTPGLTEDAETKFVHRHLVTGDAMLLNRQPTLHKPSIMAHRARVLKGEKVMRMHYGICKSYNADFDGDEMNAHFPQDEVARSEAYNIVSVCKQYLVPKDGTPLQGLIQDHVIAGVKMTMRGRFFTKDEYQQLVFGALVDSSGKIKTLPPTIIKPEMLWSGKQIISTIILNLVPEGKAPVTLDSSAKIKAQEWQNGEQRFCKVGGPIPSKKMPNNTTMSESEVIIRKGELLAGILDKNQYGATPYSLVHAFFELYGGTYSAKLLSCFSKLFTNFLHTEGFTLGVKDILVTNEANKKRKKIMKKTRKLGDQLAAKGVGLEVSEDNPDIDRITLAEKLEEYHRASRTNPKKRAEIDRAYKEKLTPANNEINSVCLPRGLVTKFPYNNLQLMVQSGAKGSAVNTMQISCLLGQIELEGKRPPLMISGKSLPSFVPYDTQPRAGGYIDGRFMSGIRPQEFFFHCMAGREGLIDTAVKTSRSGYLQRCLVKLLEGLMVNYDLTVRDSDGSVVQFRYGEDSMDVCKSRYLNEKQLDFLYENKDSLIDKRSVEIAKRFTDVEGLEKAKKGLNKWKKKQALNENKDGSKSGAFMKFCKERALEVKPGFSAAEVKKHLVDEWSNLMISENRDDRKFRKNLEKRYRRCPDPVVSDFRPDSNFGSVTEAVDQMIDNYIILHEHKKNFDSNEFREMMYLKTIQSMVDPGEPVGAMAAQSVGEPSTQMTLNTFHFAGRGEMNVTLGIPRLREILMVASANIKTPSMTIPFLPGITEKEREKLRLRFNRVALADVVERVEISESYKLDGNRMRIFKIRFEFLPKKYYKDRFLVTPSQILKYFEARFISKVFGPVLHATMREKKVFVDVKADKETSEKPKRGSTDQNGEGNRKEDTNDNERNIDAAEKGGVGEGHVSSDDEELADDADATEARKKSRQLDEDFDEGLSDEEQELFNDLAKQIAEEEGEQEDQEQNQSLDDSKKVLSQSLRANGEDDDAGFEDLLDQAFKEEDIKNREWEESVLMENDPEAQKRKLNVLNLVVKGVAQILDYSYDTNKELWCQLTLGFPPHGSSVDMASVVRKACEKAVIHQVKNIKRAFLIKNQKDEMVLTTEGVNLEEAFQYDATLDLKRLECNNIHDVARYYGIEAANRTIVREIVNVFRAYGIDVDRRHLTLIADYMTHDGTYKPFNRIGIADNPSPLQQMTFETAIAFVRSAVLAAKKDNLRSPSAAVVVGKPCAGGTAGFAIMHDIHRQYGASLIAHELD